MDNKMKYIKYKKLTNPKIQDFYSSQDKYSIDYNIEVIKKDIAKGVNNER